MVVVVIVVVAVVVVVMLYVMSYLGEGEEAGGAVLDAADDCHGLGQHVLPLVLGNKY